MTAGFFSKDASAACLVDVWWAWPNACTVLGLLTALMTAFYSFRLVFVTFWGESRVDPKHASHIHEPSKTMTVPLLILAVLSILAGYIGIPEFLAPAFPGGEGGGHHEGAAATGIMIAATAAMGCWVLPPHTLSM